MSDQLTALLLDSSLQEDNSHFLDEAVRGQARDSRITSMLADSTIERTNRTQKAFSNTNGRKEIHLRQKLSPKQEAQLEAQYYMFHLDFRNAIDTHPHNYERCARKLSEHLLFEMLSYRSESYIPEGYDVHIKDVGANPIVHLNAGRRNIHSCCPVLSFQDAIRKSRLRMSLLDYDLTACTKEQKLVHAAYSVNLQRSICANRAQACSIKAQKLYFLHSTYDMSVEDIANAMFVSNALEAAGCFHFDPIILFNDYGTLPDSTCRYKKFVRNGRLYIRFWFDGDTQLGYEHDYINYLSLLKSFVIRPTYGSTSYLVDLPYRLGSVQYFHIRKNFESFIPRSVAFRALTSVADKYVIVYTYQWVTIVHERTKGVLDFLQKMCLFFTRQRTNHMRRVRLVVPRVLFDRLYMYTVTLPDSKFVIQNVVNAAATFNTREIINGQSVGVPEPMDPSNLYTLATAIYIRVFRNKWCEGKVLKNLKDSEMRTRDAAGTNVVNKFFKLHRKAPDDVKFDEMLTDELNDVPGFFSKLFTTFSKEYLNSQYEVFIDEASHFVDIDAEIDAVIQVKAKLPEYILDLNLDEEKSALSSASSEIVECDFNYVEQDVPGDGDCLFHSLAKLGMNVGNITELRKCLADHTPKVAVESVQDTRNRFLALSSPEKYMTEDNIRVIADYFEIVVCIHNDQLCERFGRGDVIRHIRYRNNHYTPLVESSRFCGDSYDLYIAGDGDVNLDDLYNERNRLRDKIDREDWAQQRRDDYTLAGVDSNGWLSRSAMKLLEINDKFGVLKNDIRILDLYGAPGGFAQVCLDNTNSHVYGVTLVQKGHTPENYDPCVRRDKFHQVYGKTKNGDLDDDDNVLSIIEALYGEKNFQLILSDAARNFYDDDQDYQCRAFVTTMNMALSLLSRGGTVVVRVPDIAHERMLEAYKNFCLHFATFHYFKPALSHPATSEGYLILMGYMLCTKERDVSSRILDVQAILLRKQIVGLSNVLKSIAGVSQCLEDRCKIYKRKYGRKYIGGGPVFSSPQVPVITEVDGDIFECEDNMAHCISQDLRMSKGIAKDFVCVLGSDVRSELSKQDHAVGDVPHVMYKGKYVYHLVTKKFFYDKPTDDSIRCALRNLREDMKGRCITTISMPRIACGLDGKQYQDIRKIIEEEMIGIKVTIYNYSSAGKTRAMVSEPAHRVEENRKDLKHQVTVKEEKSDVLPVPKFVEKKNFVEPLLDVKQPKRDVYQETCRAAFYEYVQLLRSNIALQLSEHKKVYQMCRSRVSLVDKRKLLEGFRGGYRYLKADEESDYTHYFDGTEFKPNDGSGGLVSDYCLGLVDSYTYAVLDSLSYSSITTDVGVIQAAAGCGKTHYALENHDMDSSIVLTMTRTARADMLERVLKKNEGVDQMRYRTMASYLMHGYRGEVKELWIDEAYMCHPGAIVAAILLSGACKVRLLGDELQIPYINRNRAFGTKFQRPTSLFKVLKILDISRRVPLDVAARLHSKYLDVNRRRGILGGMYSSSSIKHSLSNCKINGVNDVPRGKGVYLTFTRSEMQKLKENGYYSMTVNMAQGLEWDHVAIVRLNDRLAERVFNDDEQVVTAITRHKKSCVYYTRVAGDKTYKIINETPSEAALNTVRKP